MDQRWAFAVLLSYDGICCFVLFCFVYLLLLFVLVMYFSYYGEPDAAKSKQTNSSLAELYILALGTTQR